MMRLLQLGLRGELIPTENLVEDLPKYAILSHTWGSDYEEVTLSDLRGGSYRGKSGYRKIQFCGEQAQKDGLQHFWVDTCCIDKTNSVELQEAINSMFRWYQKAARCYVYLSDVSMHPSSDQAAEPTWVSALKESRWFTRGWTLQELIAPCSVEFFSREWERIGDKKSLERQIEETTNIPLLALQGASGYLSSFSVNERFKWAANRTTTRDEDQAYSLLGIFGIHMPLIYGEGKESALKRLKDEINKPSKELHDALQWLSPVDFALDQHDIISQRHEGTGQWFLDSPTFQNWLYGDRNWNILFCPGIPGAGKTIMAAVAIDHISRLREKKGLATGLAYVFCKYKAQADQSVSSLFAALLKQLVRSRPQTTAATTLIQWHIGGNCQPLLDELAEKMQSVCADYSTVYIVVDALDECDDKGGDRSRLVDKLCDLQVRGNSDVRLLFTSRLIPDIEQRFQGAHQLTIHADNDDVRQFVAAQMPRLSNCIKRDEGLKALAQNAIVESVDGMFLLARLHVDSLLDKWTRHEVLTMLAKLSKRSAAGEALKNAYGEVIKRIDGQPSGARLLAKRVLSWVTYAQRPLTTKELCHALAVRPGDKILNHDNLYDSEDLISVCAGLVTVQSGAFGLVHYTAQEYLVSACLHWYPDSQEEIAVACLTYLSFDTFQSDSCTCGESYQASDEHFKHRLAENQFYEYAGCYWAEHVRPKERSDVVSDLALALLSNEAFVGLCYQPIFILGGESMHNLHLPAQETGLHLTARWGLSYLTDRLLEEKQGDSDNGFIEKLDRYGATAIVWAACCGHTTIVKMLLDAGADAYLNPKSGRSSFAGAAMYGHTDVVKLLLDAGAEVDIKYEHNRTALRHAAINGHEEVVELLLAAGANPDFKKNSLEDETALNMAALGGCVAIVKLLLEAGGKAGLDYTDDWQSLLLVANRSQIDHRHIAVVKLLLEAGVSGWEYALESAMFRGHDAIVNLLLNKVLLDVKGKWFWALSAVEISVGEGAAERLLNKLVLEAEGKVDADAEDENHEEKSLNLWWAIKLTNVAAVKLLLQSGADVNAENKDGGNVLLTLYHEIVTENEEGAGTDAETDGEAATDTENEETATDTESEEAAVKQIQEARARANKENKDNRTALWWCARFGHETIVRVLLEEKDSGIDVDQWWNAARKGLAAVIKLLVENEQLVDDIEEVSVALHKRLREEPVAVARLLLEAGARIDTDELWRSALESHEEFVEGLADRKDEVDTDALWEAAREWYEILAGLLENHTAI